MCQGIVEEFAGIDLGDKRLNDRSRTILSALSASPQASINAACGEWKDTMGCYRFMENDNVPPEALLAPHRDCTLRRIDQEATVLILQDTTELDFSDHPAEDSGVLDREYRKGWYDHTHLACTPDGKCLGVVKVDLFDRTAESLGRTTERRNLPLEEKESYRWLEGYDTANEIQQQVPNTKIISVGDSESDIYDIYLRAASEESNVDFIVRAKLARNTLERAPEQGKNAYVSVRDKVENSKLIATQCIELSRTPKRAARTAALEIRAKTVEVRPPHKRRQLAPVMLNVVSVIEVGRPADDPTAINWLLITSLPIDSLLEIQRVIDYYKARWHIEVYFRVLKSGCRVEDMQLKANIRRHRCLMFYKIIAWRILYLTYLGKKCPDLPCTAAFAEEEWKAAWTIVEDDPLPDNPPSINEFIPILAALGGFNRRTGDGDPGPQVIWMGLRRLADFALAWEKFRQNDDATSTPGKAKSKSKRGRK